MAHTPGPWTIHGWGDGHYEVNAAAETVCNVPGFDDATVAVDTAEDNARLIAAAPELLAALNRAYAALDWAECEWDSKDGAGRMHDCRVAIRPVIAKAEGWGE